MPDATDIVLQAIDTGFSHIDTAQAYKNEASVGEAIRESGLARDEIFVTTKYIAGPIQDAFHESLDKLGLKYVNLYLIHGPMFVAPDFEGSWRILEKFKEDGLAKSIGVSNFGLEQLQLIVKIARIKPAIEFHPYIYAQHKPVLEYSAKHDIVTEGYSSLAPITKFPGGPVDVPIAAAARRLGITPNQVIFAWVKAKGVVIVTTSSKKERLEEYLAVGDLPSLTEEEIAAIDEAGAKGPSRTLAQRGRSNQRASLGKIKCLDDMIEIIVTTLPSESTHETVSAGRDGGLSVVSKRAAKTRSARSCQFPTPPDPYLPLQRLAIVLGSALQRTVSGYLQRVISSWAILSLAERPLLIIPEAADSIKMVLEICTANIFYRFDSPSFSLHAYVAYPVKAGEELFKQLYTPRVFSGGASIGRPLGSGFRCTCGACSDTHRDTRVSLIQGSLKKPAGTPQKVLKEILMWISVIEVWKIQSMWEYYDHRMRVKLLLKYLGMEAEARKYTCFVNRSTPATGLIVPELRLRKRYGHLFAIMSAIQVVDFANFLSGEGKKGTADAMLTSFKETGFVYLVNHGFPDHETQNMFHWSKKFFSLSYEEKMLAPHPPSGTHHRGYSPPGLEKVTQHVYDASELAANRAKLQDVKESFESGREEDETMPNIWLPENLLPGFKDACLEFFWATFELQKNILRALAVAFDLPEDYFVQFHTKPDNQLRLLRYPSVPLAALNTNQITRIDGHSDFGSITIVFQDDVGGLEVEDPNDPGSFLVCKVFSRHDQYNLIVELKPVPPVPGSVIVNAGDFLMRWSNDIIRSTVHRVRAPPGAVSADGMVPERYSIPYDFSTVVDAIPGTWSDERPKRYEPISRRPSGTIKRAPPSVSFLNFIPPLRIGNQAILLVQLQLRALAEAGGLSEGDYNSLVAHVASNLGSDAAPPVTSSPAPEPLPDSSASSSELSLFSESSSSENETKKSRGKGKAKATSSSSPRSESSKKYLTAIPSSPSRKRAPVAQVDGPARRTRSSAALGASMSMPSIPVSGVATTIHTFGPAIAPIVRSAPVGEAGASPAGVSSMSSASFPVPMAIPVTPVIHAPIASTNHLPFTPAQPTTNVTAPSNHALASSSSNVSGNPSSAVAPSGPSTARVQLPAARRRPLRREGAFYLGDGPYPAWFAAPQPQPANAPAVAAPAPLQITAPAPVPAPVPAAAATLPISTPVAVVVPGSVAPAPPVAALIAAALPAPPAAPITASSSSLPAPSSSSASILSLGSASPASSPTSSPSPSSTDIPAPTDSQNPGSPTPSSTSSKRSRDEVDANEGEASGETANENKAGPSSQAGPSSGPLAGPSPGSPSKRRRTD
ncbi:hypothetical protein DXG01_002686 [Tephrocybe rancida]|nr:hypothetical protein DXG01_002686 [Tephrocybe rancida]